MWLSYLNNALDRKGFYKAVPNMLQAVEAHNDRQWKSFGQLRQDLYHSLEAAC
jgi:hypothetical protein